MFKKAYKMKTCPRLPCKQNRQRQERENFFFVQGEHLQYSIFTATFAP